MAPRPSIRKSLAELCFILCSNKSSFCAQCIVRYEICSYCNSEYTGSSKISRRDNKTTICAVCSEFEALHKFAIQTVRKPTEPLLWIFTSFSLSASPRPRSYPLLTSHSSFPSTPAPALRAPPHRSESPTGYSSASCSPAAPASASPVTDNSSIPIQRGNEGCHLYMALTLQSRITSSSGKFGASFPEGANVLE
jgi:hypothetical protein